LNIKRHRSGDEHARADDADHEHRDDSHGIVSMACEHRC
jgi:hypothetical protein